MEGHGTYAQFHRPLILHLSSGAQHFVGISCRLGVRSTGRGLQRSLGGVGRCQLHFFGDQEYPKPKFAVSVVISSHEAVLDRRET